MVDFFDWIFIFCSLFDLGRFWLAFSWSVFGGFEKLAFVGLFLVDRCLKLRFGFNLCVGCFLFADFFFCLILTVSGQKFRTK